MFLLRSSANKTAKLLQHIFWKCLFFKVKKRAAKPYGCFVTLRSLSLLLRSSVSCHGSCFCLLMPLLYTPLKLRFVPLATHPTTASIWLACGSLRAAAWCWLKSLRQSGKPCVVRSSRSVSLHFFHFHIAAKRVRSSHFFCTTLVQLTAATPVITSDCKPFRYASLFASSFCLFCSRLFFLWFSHTFRPL